jgi:hypothetical protein
MHPSARTRLLVLAAVACVICCSAVSAWAQNEVLQRKISRTGKANHEAILSGHVRLDRNCASLGAPQINLEQPPAHGVMCLRAGNVRLQYLVGNAPANCLGGKAAGVRVVYRPHDGYTGKDEARYIVQFPKARVTVDVDLTIVPDDRPSPNGEAPAGSIPAEETQKPGLVPACAELVS